MRKQGFSLIELVVVLSILATLAVLSFPVVGKAKRGLHVNRCMSQLHQIGLAMRLYQEDHHKRPWPLGRLAPDYIGSADLLVCPWVALMIGDQAVKTNDRLHREQQSASWSSYFMFYQEGLDDLYRQGRLPISYTEIINLRRGATPIVLCVNHREAYPQWFVEWPANWVFPEEPILVLRLDGSVSRTMGGGVFQQGTGWGTLMWALKL